MFCFVFCLSIARNILLSLCLECWVYRCESPYLALNCSYFFLFNWESACGMQVGIQRRTPSLLDFYVDTGGPKHMWDVSPQPSILAWEHGDHRRLAASGFTRFWGSKLRSSHLYSKYSTHRPVSQAPKIPSPITECIQTGLLTGYHARD